MKKINLLKGIVLCCLLAIGCGGPQTEEVQVLKQQNDSLQKLNDSLRFSAAKEIGMPLVLPALPPALPLTYDWCNGRITGNRDHEINLTKAKDYIWAYNWYFNSLARSKGAYSQIPRATLSAFDDSIPAASGTDTNRCGLLMCFYESNNKFFVASRPTNNANLSSRPTPIMGDDLTRNYFFSVCSTPFYPNSFSTEATLLDYLKDSVNSCNAPSTDSLGSSVNPGSNRFRNTFNNLPTGGSASTEPYAFFHYDQIRKVIRQTNCTGVRIYWGYDAAAGKIKLVVFGITSEGKNITGTGAKILERSWPPYVAPPIKKP